VPQESAGQRRLASAQVAVQEDDVPTPRHSGQRRAEPLRFCELAQREHELLLLLHRHPDLDTQYSTSMGGKSAFDRRRPAPNSRNECDTARAALRPPAGAKAEGIDAKFSQLGTL
jgi:hypothetical protein